MSVPLIQYEVEVTIRGPKITKAEPLEVESFGYKKVVVITYNPQDRCKDVRERLKKELGLMVGDARWLPMRSSELMMAESDLMLKLKGNQMNFAKWLAIQAHPALTVNIYNAHKDAVIKRLRDLKKAKRILGSR